VKAICSSCGTKMATLDDGTITYSRYSYRVDDPTFLSAARRGDLAVVCPRPRCGERYDMVEVLRVMRAAGRSGKNSVKLHH
jgi:hypothetical protein